MSWQERLSPSKLCLLSSEKLFSGLLVVHGYDCSVYGKPMSIDEHCDIDTLRPSTLNTMHRTCFCVKVKTVLVLNCYCFVITNMIIVHDDRTRILTQWRRHASPVDAQHERVAKVKLFSLILLFVLLVCDCFVINNHDCSVWWPCQHVDTVTSTRFARRRPKRTPMELSTSSTLSTKLIF